MTAQDWPSAIRWNLVNAIATRIKSSVNPSYRRQCLSALASLRLPVEILNNLDREAKSLLSGDASAAKFICELLDPIASHTPRPSWATQEGQARVRQAVAALTHDPAGFQSLPPDGVVNPVAMLLIDRAVEYSAGPEPSRRMAYAFAMDWLWRESVRLDALARYAIDESEVQTERFEALIRVEREFIRRGNDLHSRLQSSLAEQELQTRSGDPTALPNDSASFDDVLRGVLIGKIFAQPAEFESAPPSLEAYPIFSISPNRACAGELLTIRGRRFGSRRRANVKVVLDTKDPDLGVLDMDVVSWSDSEIVVRVPPNATSGCIGIKDFEIDLQGLRRWKLRHEFLGKVNTVRELQGFPPLHIPQNIAGEYLPDAVPCTATNRFLGTLPEILRFESNGAFIGANRPPAIQPGTHLVLSWQVANADSVAIQRTSTQGPPLTITALPSAGSRDLGPFQENRLVRATYTMSATNRCGTVVEHIHVLLRSRPHLRVLGIEVTQAIQRFDVLGLGARNNVPLVSRHRTVARVYLESGLSGGFDFGTGPDRLPVTGAELHLTTPSGSRTVQPLNPNAEAFPAAALSFDSGRTESLDTSGAKALNFLLPWDVLDGNVSLSMNVRAADGGPGTTASGFTQVLFRPRRRFRVIFAPVMDTLRNLPTPSRTEFVMTWRDAVARLPLSEEHWLSYWYTAPLSMDHDLADEDGWHDLIDDVEDLFDDLDLDESTDLLIALTQSDAAYAAGGIAGMAPLGGGVNVAVCMIGDGQTLAHEVTHAFGIGHSALGASLVDPSLPSQIEDVGVNLANNSVVLRGMADLMLGLGGNGPVPSIVLWERLFNLFS